MKLKKIASLMLAGIMAVSMLAGCSNGNSNSGNNGGETNTATGVAAAFNDAQASTNAAKITFSSDATLDAALAQALKIEGQNALPQAVGQQVSFITGIISDSSAFVATDAASKDGLTITRMYADKLNSKDNNVWTEEAAVKTMGRTINTDAAKLKDTTYVKGTTQADQPYFNYTYTGKASMVSVNNTDGTVDYYFVYTITQTCAEATLA